MASRRFGAPCGTATSPSKNTVYAEEQRRPDVVAERRRWRDGLPLRDVRQYIFLDECGVTTDLLRRYGRSRRGLRLHDHTPCGHWQTHTVIVGLRPDGLSAPAVFDGPIDTPSFLAYVEQVLVPTLRSGDVVVLDNLAVHKQPGGARGDRSRRGAVALSPALQSRLQPDRARVRQTQRLLTRGPTAQLRSGHRPGRCGPRPLHTPPRVGITSDTAAIGSLYRCEKRSSHQPFPEVPPPTVSQSSSAQRGVV